MPRKLEEFPEAIVRLFAAITRRLPPVRGLGRFGQLLMRRVSDRISEPIAVRNRDAWIVADPRVGAFDAIVVFLPQFDHRRELDFVLSNLREGDTFVDVGANIGKFTLPSASRVGERGRVIAIEPEPGNAALPAIELNGFENIEVHEVAIAVERGFGLLNLNATGNRGAHSLVVESQGGASISVPLARLEDLVAASPRALKLDIEGLDEDVILDLLVSTDLRPGFIVLEQRFSGLDTEFVGSIVRAGYEAVGSSERNLMLRLRPT